VHCAAIFEVRNMFTACQGIKERPEPSGYPGNFNGRDKRSKGSIKHF
jgi:hypothetical protein